MQANHSGQLCLWSLKREFRTAGLTVELKQTCVETQLYTIEYSIVLDYLIIADYYTNKSLSIHKKCVLSHSTLFCFLFISNTQTYIVFWYAIGVRTLAKANTHTLSFE